MSKGYITILALFLVAACATVPKDTVFAIDVSSEDDPSSESIRVSYNNTTAKTVCLTPENWPNSAGKINQASDIVWLEIGKERYPLKDFNTGSCSSCVERVGPDRRISASIPYSEFDLPANLTKASKVLHFQPTAFYCGPKS
jgi:hypothetical protein